MKKVFLIIFSAVVVCSQYGCGGNPPANNISNLSSPTATPTPKVETNQNANFANANVKQDIPVPTFTDANTAFSEGNKYFDTNETEKSIEAFKQAVKLDPNLAEAYFKLGVSYALLEKENAKTTIPGEAEEAAKAAKTAKKGSKNSKGKFVAPRTTDSEKAFDEAVKAYKKIVAKNPKDDLAQYNLGRAYSKLNEDEDSEKALRLAVKLKPDDSEYQRELGATLNKLAKYDEAIKALKKSASLEPDNSQTEDLLEKAQAGKKRVDFGKAKNEEKNAVDKVNDKGSSSGKTKDNNPSTPPKDKREPPRKVENNEVKISKPN
jgi:tetratricopeptide (TPR) repeat protein